MPPFDFLRKLSKKAKDLGNSALDTLGDAGDTIGNVASDVEDAAVPDSPKAFARKFFDDRKLTKAIEEPSLGNIAGAGLEAATTAATGLGVGKALLFRTSLGSSANPNGDYAQRPSATSSPDEIRSYIDKAIGKQPRDDEIVRFLTETYPRFSKLVSADAPARVGSSLQPYMDDTAARMATGNIPPALNMDPYSPLDQKIMGMVQGDNRFMQQYLKLSDPAKLLPYLPPEINPRKMKTMFSMAKDGVMDFAGRPIGAALEALSWPSQQVENFIGNQFVWNHVQDPTVRRQLAKYAYEYGVTPTDWHMHNPAIRDITQKANEITASGLHGDQAMAALQPALKENMSTRAAVFGFLASGVLDPLNIIPFGGLARGAGKVGIKGLEVAVGAEKAGEFAELAPKGARLLGPGRMLLGDHTAKEILAADEMTYQGWRVANPARGPILRLFEQTPSGFASETLRRMNNVFTRNEDLNPETLGVLDRVLRTGKMDDEAVNLLGDQFLNDPRMARFSAIMQGRDKSLTEEIFGVGKKGAAALERVNELSAQLSPDEAGYLMRTLITAHIHDIAATEQEKYLPKFLMRRVRPLVNAEKFGMGIATLSRPSFIPLNMTNNLFTFMWSATPRTAGDYLKTWGQSMFTQFTTGLPGASYPDAFKALLSSADISPAVAEDIIHSGSSGGDLLALRAKKLIHSDEMDADDVSSILNHASTINKNPAKIRDDFSWKSVIAWPVEMASRVDIATKRATYMMSLKEQQHWGMAPKVLMPGIRDRLISNGVHEADADKLATSMVSRIRDEAKKGVPVFKPEEMERIYKETLNDLADDIVPHGSALHYLQQWAGERGITGDAAWAHIATLQDIEPQINAILDDIPDISKRSREARLAGVVDNLYDFDYLQSVLTHTQPVIRTGFDYAKSLRVTEDSLRQATVDNIGHLDRLFNQVYAGRWNGKLRRNYYETITKSLSDQMDELSEIRRVHGAAIVAGKEPHVETADLWKQFWENKKKATDTIYNTSVKAVGDVHKGPLEKLDAWYKNEKELQGRREELLADALQGGEDAKWGATGTAMRNLFTSQARKNADIFGWTMNEQPINYGHTRPSALVTQRADDFVDWLKKKITTDMAPPVEEHPRIKEIKTRMRDINRAFRPPAAPEPVTEEVATGLKPAIETRYKNEHTKLTGRALSIDNLLAGRKPPTPPRNYGNVEGGAGTLPKELQGAKPRYKTSSLEFESDVDKAAYIASQTGRLSKRDADYVQFVMDHTGMERDEVRAAGREIRENLKSAVPDDDDVIRVGQHLDVNKPAGADEFQGQLDAFNIETASLQQEKSKIMDRIHALEDKLNPKPPEAAAPEAPAKFAPDNAAELKAEKKALSDELKGLEAASPGAAQHAARRNMLASLDSSIPDLTRNAQDISSTMRANAMAKTDFVMLNYNQQFGIDSAMQAFFPYLFFPTRSLMNWGKRMALAPGSAAMISKALVHPGEYAQLYGYPTRVDNMVPVPMPFLDDILSKLPIANSLMQKGQMGHAHYWIDPMQLMFPMSNYTNDYEDDKKKSTPLGMAADWLENNTPFSLSPVAKILGSETGLLDKSAWEQGTFNGGPFGIPMTPTARAVAGWLQNGETENVPEDEMNNYTNGGFFSKSFLGRIMGLSNERFDEYRSERALWSMVAQGDAESDKAWAAMLNHTGPIWREAVRRSQGEQFLREFTGSVFARVTPISEGELKLKLAEKAAYNQAQLGGPDAMAQFQKHFPEYSGYQAAVKGLSDPEDRQSAVETELYYKNIAKYAEQPYQLRLDRLNGAIDQLTNQTQTEATRNQMGVLKTQRAALNLEKKGIRATLEKAFPNREKDLSINRDPYDRAMAMVRSDFYGIADDETPLTDDQIALVRRVILNDNPKSKDVADMRKLAEDQAAKDNIPYKDLQSMQNAYLAQFPSKEAGADPTLWHQLTVDSLTTKMNYGLMMNQAIENEDFDKYRKLQTAKNGALDAIHDKAMGQVTRWDVENYLNRFERPKSPQETQFEDANNLFDMWMSLVGDKSVLSSDQKNAVSAYFRSRPEIKAHYYSSTLPLLKDGVTPLTISGKNDNLGGLKPTKELGMTPEQTYALMRRREIWRTYYDMDNDQAQMDYMHTVQNELTHLNATLGMGKIQMLDYQGIPPYAALGDGGGEFRHSPDQKAELAQILQMQGLSAKERADLESLVMQKNPGTLSHAEIDREIQMSMQRGY